MAPKTRYDVTRDELAEVLTGTPSYRSFLATAG